MNIFSEQSISRTGKLLKKGKVRSVYALDADRLLIVASDRISAFDVVLPTQIPGKGIVLTQLSNFWFDFLSEIIPNHLITTQTTEFPDSLKPFARDLDGRSVIVQKLNMLPFEFIVRGYISGSLWKAYKSGEVPGDLALQAGLSESEKLDEPLFTPTTKAEEGHDLPVTRKELADAIGIEMTRRIEETVQKLYSRAAKYAESKGLILADSKLEFGYLQDQLVLADELFTPDSSRFWPLDSYQPGRPQASFDKQYIRDYLSSLQWDKTSPGPELPEDIVRASIEKYHEAYKILTGKTLDHFLCRSGSRNDEA